MTRPDRRSLAFLAAAVIFGLAAVHAIVHLATLAPFGELPLGLSLAMAAINVLLFAGAAIGLTFRARSPRLAAMGYDLSWVGALWMLWHGLTARLVGDLTGIAYIVLALAVAVLIKRSFEPLVHAPEEPRRAERPAPSWMLPRRPTTA